MTLTIWHEQTREELKKALPESIVLLPTGATEQHGPHLVTGLDAMTVTAIAREASSRAASPVVLAPTLEFGSSHHHLPFGGTLSLSTETYYRVVRDLVESMIAGGARRVLLLNGHGGNQELIQLVVRDVALASDPDAPVTLAAASYWQIAAEALAAELATAEFPFPGHAGQFETAVMLATFPQHVREPRPKRDTDPYLATVTPGMRVESTGLWQVFDGYTDFPDRATAELGERLLDVIVGEVSAALDALGARRL